MSRVICDSRPDADKPSARRRAESEGLEKARSGLRGAWRSLGYKPARRADKRSPKGVTGLKVTCGGNVAGCEARAVHLEGEVYVVAGLEGVGTAGMEGNGEVYEIHRGFIAGCQRDGSSPARHLEAGRRDR